jgi:hypothetical protein
MMRWIFENRANFHILSLGEINSVPNRENGREICQGSGSGSGRHQRETGGWIVWWGRIAPTL